MGGRWFQAVNLNTWPATLFIGKDGRVKATCTRGLLLPAVVCLTRSLKRSSLRPSERLLKEKVGGSRPGSELGFYKITAGRQ